MYKEHRRAELRQEVDVITTFVNKNGVGSVDRILDFYHRIFSFDLQSSSNDTRNKLVDTLLLARVSKFGLAAALTKKYGTSVASSDLIEYNIVQAGQSAPTVSSSNDTDGCEGDGDSAARAKKKAKEKMKKAAAAAAAAILESAAPVTSLRVAPGVSAEMDAARSHLTECLDEYGRLVFRKIFDNSKTTDKEGNEETATELPVKLEICSGGGEWVVKQVLPDVINDK